MTDIIADTRSRLVRFRGRYQQIAKDHQLGYSWLSKFARGDRGLRPSFDLISKLQAALDALEKQDKKVANEQVGKV